MPRVFSLSLTEQLIELLYDLVCEIFCKSLSDSSKTLGGTPPDDTLLVFERLKKNLDDELKLFEVNLIFIEHLLVLLLYFLRLLVLVHKVTQGS